MQQYSYDDKAYVPEGTTGICAVQRGFKALPDARRANPSGGDIVVANTWRHTISQLTYLESEEGSGRYVRKG